MNFKNLKSWQISSVAVIASAIIFLYWLWQVYTLPPHLIDDDLASLDGIFVVFALMSFVGLLFTLCPTLLLKIDKTKKLGAILCIIFGVVMGGYFVLTYASEVNLELIERLVMLLTVGGPQGLLLLIAGVHYFWKKV